MSDLTSRDQGWGPPCMCCYGWLAVKKEHRSRVPTPAGWCASLPLLGFQLGKKNAAKGTLQLATAHQQIDAHWRTRQWRAHGGPDTTCTNWQKETFFIWLHTVQCDARKAPSAAYAHVQSKGQPDVYSQLGGEHTYTHVALEVGAMQWNGMQSGRRAGGACEAIGPVRGNVLRPAGTWPWGRNRNALFEPVLPLRHLLLTTPRSCLRSFPGRLFSL